MGADVKEEKYGTRRSVLEPILKENGIRYSKNLWLVTCRASVNKDRDTRYLVFLESLSEKGTERIDLTLDGFREEIRDRVYCVFLDEEKSTVYIKEIKSGQRNEVSYADFRNLVIRKTDCKYEESYARGSEEATPFSRFFRENMGKGFSLTDVDFVLMTRENHVFVEEKTFIENGNGYLGWGQCLSYNELIKDVLVPQARLYIAFIGDSDEFYIKDLKEIGCQNRKYVEGWGQMVRVALGESLDRENLISWIKKL
jgi:hypothetical protein